MMLCQQVMSTTASALLKGILPGIYSTGTKGTCWTCLSSLLILFAEVGTASVLQMEAQTLVEYFHDHIGSG